MTHSHIHRLKDKVILQVKWGNHLQIKDIRLKIILSKQDSHVLVNQEILFMLTVGHHDVVTGIDEEAEEVGLVILLLACLLEGH